MERIRIRIRIKMSHSPCTQGVGPLRPTPAHPVQSLRDGLVFRLRGGIGFSLCSKIKEIRKAKFEKRKAERFLVGLYLSQGGVRLEP